MRIDDYLAQCGVRALCEDATVENPPTPEEVSGVLRYLAALRLEPVVIGGVAVFHHLRDLDPAAMRPTVDLDLFVKGPLPTPPPGWRVDPESIGVPSWISPSGGQVDFILAGSLISGKFRAPKAVAVAADSPGSYPIVSLPDLFKLKLGTFRPKDQSDLMALASVHGVPLLTGLTRDQVEDLHFLQRYADHLKRV